MVSENGNNMVMPASGLVVASEATGAAGLFYS